MPSELVVRHRLTSWTGLSSEYLVAAPNEGAKALKLSHVLAGPIPRAFYNFFRSQDFVRLFHKRQ